MEVYIQWLKRIIGQQLLLYRRNKLFFIFIFNFLLFIKICLFFFYKKFLFYGQDFIAYPLASIIFFNVSQIHMGFFFYFWSFYQKSTKRDLAKKNGAFIFVSQYITYSKGGLVIALQLQMCISRHCLDSRQTCLTYPVFLHVSLPSASKYFNKQICLHFLLKS